MSVNSNWANNPEYVPDPKWKEWTHRNLNDSSVCWVSDIDSVIRSREGCVMIVEIKRQNAEMKPSQSITYGMIAGALKACEGDYVNHPALPYGQIFLRRFLGIVELIFENTWFDDGEVFIKIDGGEKKLISEKEAISLLSFKDYCFECFPDDNCGCPETDDEESPVQ